MRAPPIRRGSRASGMMRTTTMSSSSSRRPRASPTPIHSSKSNRYCSWSLRSHLLIFNRSPPRRPRSVTLALHRPPRFLPSAERAGSRIEQFRHGVPAWSRGVLVSQPGVSTVAFSARLGRPRSAGTSTRAARPLRVVGDGVSVGREEARLVRSSLEAIKERWARGFAWWNGAVRRV